MGSQDPGGARLPLPDLDPLLFWAVALQVNKSHVAEEWEAGGAGRITGQVEESRVFGSLTMSWMDSAQPKWPGSSQGSQELKV